MKFLNDKLLDSVTVALSQATESVDVQTMVLADITASLLAANPSNVVFVDADVTVATDSVNSVAHGFTTGMKIDELTTTGTLPAGLSLSTVYYAIRVDDDNFQFAISQANALAGTPVTITAAAGGGDHTVVVSTTIAGSVKVQKNNEPSGETALWIDLDDDEVLNTTNSQAFTGTVNLNWVIRYIPFWKLRLLVTTTSGTVVINIRINAKG